MDFPIRVLALGKEFDTRTGDRWSSLKADIPVDFDSNSPYAIGGRRSFGPALGSLLWDLQDTKLPFEGCIYRLPDNRQVGYVRVPHYLYNKNAVNRFGELMAYFEGKTSAMVIDQVNNPGGSVFQMYAMLSYLAKSALLLPKHELSLSDEEKEEASEVMEKEKQGNTLPPDERPSPALVAYSRFVLSEIEAGRTKTDPVYLFGVKEVLSAYKPYTKKIVVLINELDFSASEFLAAILQDNNRATLFGKNTAGAGGCVKQLSIPRQFGIEGITVTWTLARRTNGQPIEDMGVKPDVQYDVTADDIRSGYSGYREALLATI